MPVRSTACTLVFVMCMPMFSGKLRKVIKSKIDAIVHRGKLKFDEADYVMARICAMIFRKHSFQNLFARACALYCV